MTCSRHGQLSSTWMHPSAPTQPTTRCFLPPLDPPVTSRSPGQSGSGAASSTPVLFNLSLSDGDGTERPVDLTSARGSTPPRLPPPTPRELLCIRRGRMAACRGVGGSDGDSASALEAAGAAHQLQVGHRAVRQETVHLAPQRDGRQRVLEQPAGEQLDELPDRLARGPCRGAGVGSVRAGTAERPPGGIGRPRPRPARCPATGSPWLPTLGPPPRVGPLGPAAPGLPWLPAPALRGSALTGPGARRRFTPKASDARSCRLRFIARDSTVPGKKGIPMTASSGAE